MKYVQACPGCAGAQAVAASDAERHTRKAEANRCLAAEARYKAEKANREGRYEQGVQVEASEDHRGEAEHYTRLAERSEERAKRALAKLIGSAPKRCHICGDTGRIEGNGAAQTGDVTCG